MVCKFLVIDDRNDQRKDLSIHRILTLADQSRPALIHTLAFEPKTDDLTKLPPQGKAVDVEIEMAVRGFKWNNFQLSMAVEGNVLNVLNGKPTPTR